MNRTIAAFGAAAAALAFAAPASTHENGPVLIIRHQLRGCHAWTLGTTGVPKVSQSLWLKRGVHLEIGNNDVMPHRLVQTAGPLAALPDGPSMKGLGKMIEIRFPKPGVYRFTTKAGEDYSKGVHTIGADHRLALRVIVR